MAPITFNFFLCFLLFSPVFSQPTAPSPSSDACNGVFLYYVYASGQKIAPDLKSTPSREPYRLQSTLSVLNNGLQDLSFCRVPARRALGLCFQRCVGEWQLSSCGNGTAFAVFPNSDLETVTAGDLTQMNVQVQLVGIQFGVGAPGGPMPLNISLVNDGWLCPQPRMQGRVQCKYVAPKTQTLRPMRHYMESFCHVKMVI